MTCCYVLLVVDVRVASKPLMGTNFSLQKKRGEVLAARCGEEETLQVEGKLRLLALNL